MSMTRVLVLAALMLAFGDAASARRPPKGTDAAATAGPSPAAKAAAKEHYGAAQKLFNDHKFDEAIAEYQAAYDALPLDGFLFNIAQCHRNLGHTDEAISFFERYLNAPNVKNKAEVEAVLAELREKKAAQAAAAKIEPPKETAVAAATVPATNASETKPVEAKPVEQAKVDRPPPDAVKPPVANPVEQTDQQRTPVYKKGWFWGTVVGAVVVVGGAIGIGAAESTRLPAGSLGTADWR